MSPSLLGGAVHGMDTGSLASPEPDGTKRKNTASPSGILVKGMRTRLRV